MSRESIKRQSLTSVLLMSQGCFFECVNVTIFIKCFVDKTSTAAHNHEASKGSVIQPASSQTLSKQDTIKKRADQSLVGEGGSPGKTRSWSMLCGGEEWTKYDRVLPEP
jgi:hypothetical protein